jgi:serine/threonine protein kinase
MLICYDQRNGHGCRARNAIAARFCTSCGRSLRFALQLLDPGASIGPYRIVRLIGHGSYGAVYEAIDPRRSGQRVAIKESFAPESIALFRTEFAVLGMLDHDHLPRYDDVFEADGNGYLVMEYVPGQSLAELLLHRSEPLAEQQVLGYALQLCDVLSYLHELHPPIIHRDIKPANIRLTPGGLVKLVDFGLLKQGSAATRSSRRGLTPPYAPPEQWGGSKHTDARSDIYSLAATLYHLLTLHEPPPATDRLASQYDPLVPPRHSNPRLSMHVAIALITALELRREERYATAAAFQQALLGTAPPVHATIVMPAQSGSGRAAAVPRTAVVPQPYYPQQPADASVDNLRGHSDRVYSVAWSPDGQLLASAGWDDTLRLWEQPHNRLLRTLHAGRRPTSPLSPVGSYDHVPPPHATQRHVSGLYSVAWSPDGQLLASAGWQRVVRLWQRSGEPLAVLRGHEGVIYSVAWSPRSFQAGAAQGGQSSSARRGGLLASASSDYTVRLWRIDYGGAAGALLRVFEAQHGAIYSVAWSPSGNLLATGGAGDAAVRIWRAGDGTLLRTFRGHNADVNSVAWSPDGRMLASASRDKTLCIWRVADGALLRQITAHTDDVAGVAWSPDGALLASASGDQTLALWQSSDGGLHTRLHGHSAAVNSVAWSPDSTLLASASRDKTLRLWRA